MTASDDSLYVCTYYNEQPIAVILYKAKDVTVVVETKHSVYRLAQA